MGKLVLFMHTSLDMYAAGPNGEMHWIYADEEIFNYVGSRVDETDTALYGRVTFEMMESYWPTAAEKPGASSHDIHHANWYKNAKKVVLSKSWEGKEIPGVQVISRDLKEQVSKLKTATEKDILIFGSPTATHSLLAEELVDAVWVFINPVILGKGIPVFRNVRELRKLELVSSRVFGSGVVCLGYNIRN
ncbi:MAG TPA: dihydrofolate reductase family protein [Ferruginibacter sp.]|nr:dihydrofolate reductase family protein [Ferruginibacter sp.]